MKTLTTTNKIFKWGTAAALSAVLLYASFELTRRAVEAIFFTRAVHRYNAMPLVKP